MPIINDKYLGKMKRTTFINNYINDDIDYTITLLYSITIILNCTFKDLIEKYNFNKKYIKLYLDIAEVNHCLSFIRSSEEMVAGILKKEYYDIENEEIRNKIVYSKLNDKITPIKIFVNSLCLNYEKEKLNEWDVIYAIFKNSLADRMVDDNDILMNTQSNILLYEYSDLVIAEIENEKENSK